MADECKPVEWILLPFEASRISFYKSKYLSTRKNERNEDIVWAYGNIGITESRWRHYICR